MNSAVKSNFTGTGRGESNSPELPRIWPWLGGLIIIAAGLRVVGINKCLWWDEIYSVLISIRHSFSEIVTVFPTETQHTFYSVLARASILAFGEHAWSLRLPSLLFGVASIPVLYLLGTSVTSRIEALFSSALLTVSYHHVWFSQNARAYSMLAFWTMLSTFFLLRGIKSGRRGPYVAYAITMSLGVYTHLTMMFLLASHVLICTGTALADWRKGLGWKKWKLQMQAFLMTGGLVLLLYAPVAIQVQNVFLHRSSSMKAVSTPRWAFWEILRGLRLGFGTETVVIGAALVVACGTWSFFKQDRFVFALFILPGVLAALGVLLVRGTMYPRFYFFLIGFAIIILVRGACVIPKQIAAYWPYWLPRVNPAPALTIVFAIVLLASSVLSLRRNYEYPKQDFEGAMRFIEAEAKGEDIVVTVGATTYPYRQYYGKPWESVENGEALRNICQRGGPVWLVYTFPRYLEGAAPGVTEMIQREFTVIRVFRGTLGDGDVFVAKFQH